MRLIPTFVSEAIAPSRLGTNFRWLLSGTVINNAGDGIALAAGPLIVASLTQDPFLVSMALLSQWLPALVLGVFSGVAADRFDRRRIVIAVDLARFVVLLALVAVIVSGNVSIYLVLGALFVLGSAEAFADAASSTLVPSLVPRRDLGIANARMQGAYVLTNQLVAPPIGAFLFVAGMALPFAANAAAFALGALLISRIRGSLRSERVGSASVWADMAEGVRWLIGHPPVRTLALTTVTFNVTYGAVWGVFVLYVTQRLRMDEVGFGLVMTAMAIGGLLGTFAYGAIERRMSLGNMMRAGLIFETGFHLVLLMTTSPIVALVTLAIFGAHNFIWRTTSTVIVQRSVPNALLGRVGSAYRMSSVGGLVVGAPIGGLLASTFDITAPLLFGFIGSALLVALLWRQFPLIALGAEVATE